VISVGSGLVAAVANASQAVINKELTTRYPARQLIGALYLCNFLVLLPFAPFAEWRWSPGIIALHVLSVVLMAVTALCVWDMFEAGNASSTTTATAMSPIATAIGVALLVPSTFRPLQIVAAVIVACGVLMALRGAFVDLGRRGTVVRVLGAAIGTGLLTVTGRLLGDEGVGVVETYVVRTGLAAVVFLVVIPPRDIPLRGAPALVVRSILVTISFVFIIIGAQQGSPVVVQTLVAITPLLVLGLESVRARAIPPARGLGAAVVVIVGVVIVLLA
jgi:hypothetical protein